MSSRACSWTCPGATAGVRTGVGTPPPGATVLHGLTVPGLANTHSHAFHRALRSTVQVGSGTFWTWRETMYRTASRLTPDTYYDLARATYAEMALAGITAVGEFHYLHHAPGGTPYDDPNAMGEALIAAAAEAGIRITLLDTAYLAAGFGEKPNRHQTRFSDVTADAWAERASLLKGDDDLVVIGAAIHSVRAVPVGQLATVARWAQERAVPLHVHLSEQTARTTPASPPTAGPPRGSWPTTGSSVRAPPASTTRTSPPRTSSCWARPGRAPACAPRRNATSPTASAPPPRSRARAPPLAGQRQPCRDRPLRGGPGHGAQRTPAHPRARALDGVRAAQGGIRRRTCRARPAGRGTLEPGAPADLTTVALDSVRTAGPVPRLGAEAAVFAATAADVRHTVVAGRHIVRDGRHTRIEDVPGALASAVAALHR